MTDSSRDVVVIGAGLAGLVATLELLDLGRDVLLADRCFEHEVGGLAREAFGGVFMVDSAEQRFSRVRDTVDVALEDWLRIAGFEDSDVWPRRWAEQYVTRARDDVGGWLKGRGVRFFPVVNWAERGVLWRGQLGPALPPHLGLWPGPRRRCVGSDPEPSASVGARGPVPLPSE